MYENEVNVILNLPSPRRLGFLFFLSYKCITTTSFSLCYNLAYFHLFPPISGGSGLDKKQKQKNQDWLVQYT